ncbi:hypothetical protein SAMN02745671_00070 [Anaerovibrio lipolyticus DSM 3074]|uniref:Uncharacterized protein n=1 Tax=Anaerovibrio lipolyticus DSM 3074 TaxID=1120997 RepID=A0A1M5ZY03_9FIRM|nr:hypothetical protein [Anaerovibrio lipolyticus]SHI29144.1 hypothetical protein SAMN02745671_00070 [Anaerovibrio lipolyticus DSM 3074]
MPIPFLIAGAALLAGGVGAVGAVVAKETMDEAEEVANDGKYIVKNAEEKRDSAREKADKAINTLGEKKLDILGNSINVFVDNFKKLKNVNFHDSVGLEELKDFTPDSSSLGELQRASFSAAQIGGSMFTGLAGGSVAALGAYGAVGLLATASTGTAISTLSGVVATNATLAWLGGGSLAAGGFGVAGGMAVLGGAVLGPALLIGSFVAYAKADEALNKAKSYRAKAKQFEAECENVCSLCKAVTERAEQIKDVLVKLDKMLVNGNKNMVSIIENEGTDWNSYSDQDKRIIAGVAMTAKTLKVILDTSLLHDDGSLSKESENVLSLPLVQTL